MEGSVKVENDKDQKKDAAEAISTEVDKLVISKEDDAKGEQAIDPFEELAQSNKELADDLCDKPEALDAGEAGPENIVKDNNDLFDPNATWETLGVSEKLKSGLLDMGFVKPSKIQASTFPSVMKQPYSHLIAQSPNGSGKTGAFGVATLSRIDESQKTLQAVIFAHTRELVNQIAERLSEMAKCTNIVITALEKTNKKADVGHVVVTTPGNFDTCFFLKKMYDLSYLRVLVLDEADYMITNENTSHVCDKTFKYLQKNNMQVQVLSFSATYTPENFNTFKKYFKKAVMIQMKKEALTLKTVRQMFYKCKKREEKVEFVEEYLKRSFENERVIIFVNTRDFTVKLQQILVSKGYKVYILMGGNMDPKERDETIKKFNRGEIQILITTNVLSRGFDEKLVKLIINFDLPVQRVDNTLSADMENYLHRIGRTGRFGTKGIGLTLISDDRELKMLKDIMNYYKSNIEEIKSLDSLMEEFKKTLEEKY